MAWTESQQMAIETRDKNLLVAAAAGSGKTAVLVERIIRQILAGECDVDRLLVVTFTHAAAEEMRMRIESALRKQLEQEKDEKQQERLERQMILLSGASISTLHSFCQTVIRQNFSAIDLDPEFRLAGEQELRLMQQEVMEEIFEAEYERGDEGFLRFVDHFGGNERGDEKLYHHVLRLYRYSQSQPFPEEWIESLPSLLALPRETRLENTPWYAAIRQEIQLSLESAMEKIEQARTSVEALGAEPYVKTLISDSALFRHLYEVLEEGSWENLRQAFSTASFERLKKLGDVGEEEKEAADLALKKPREHYKGVIANLRKKYFQETEEELAEDMREAALDVRELCSLTGKFAAGFAAAKHRKSIADFNDLEHFTLQILCGSKESGTGELCPSDAAKALQQRFQAVMVDEYQDTNGVQEAILSLVTSRESPNFFCVGDVKQSIYRFRLADPMLFLEKYREYPRKGKDYARIDLARNFRSRPGVLSAINFIFAQVMTQGTMELEYDEAAALYPGAEYPPCGEPCLTEEAELDIIFGEDEEDGDAEEEEEENLKGIEREAQWIADRLKSLMSEGVRVFDKEHGEYRPLRWRDIVLLLRSVKGKAEKVLEVFRRNDIPAYAAADAGYFEEQEVRIMLALLSVLHNSRQDIPLAAVLVSPMGGLSYAELAEVRLAAPQEDLYDALLAALAPESGVKPGIAGKVSSFLGRLSHWRMLSRELSVPELIWQLYRDTGYYDYVGGLPGGLLRQANLRMLADRAAEYEKTDFRGLFRFLRFVKRMQDMDTDLAVARVLGESEDVVRIMSVHKSKGLEFPVVILADMGKKFNLQDASADLLMHRELGLGPYRVEHEEPFRYPTFARQAISAKLIQENKAEELRVLYVALTRAREKLILVGTVASQKKLQAKADQWTSHLGRTGIRLPEHASFGAESFLDWVAMAVAGHKDGETLRQLSSVPRQWRDFLDYKDTSRWSVKVISSREIKSPVRSDENRDAVLDAVARRRPLPDSPHRDKVRKLLDWQYPMHGWDRVPSKLSVTEIKRRFSEMGEENLAAQAMPAPVEWKRPVFLQEKRGLSGAEYGTLMHSVMQHIDYRGDVSYRGIQAQMKNMVEKEILLPDHLKLVRVKNIQAFFQSSLGKRLRHAKNVWRELPFSRMLPADKFYEVEGQGEDLFIQGIIDLLFEDAEGRLVLVDYKTDRDTAPERIQREYHLQVSLYRQAVEDILQREIEETYLYMLHDGSIIGMRE